MHRFHVPGMKCGGCQKAVTRAIQNVDPQARVDVNLEDRAIEVVSSEAEESLLTALREAGYPAQPIPVEQGA